MQSSGASSSTMSSTPSAGFGKHTNKSCGVSIMISTRFRLHAHVKEVYLPPATLAGRVGGLRVRRGRADDTFLVAYFPPKVHTTAKQAEYKATVQKIVDWIAFRLARTLASSIAGIAIDLNDGVGMEKQEGEWEASVESCVGPVEPDQEGFAATRPKQVAELYGLCFVNTFFPAGPTYYGANGRRSRVDYILAPLSILPHMQQCGTLGRAARRLQLIPSFEHRDHIPLQISVPRVSQGAPAARGEQKVHWDEDALMRAWRKGEGRASFLADAAKALSGVQRSHAWEHSADGHWIELVNALRGVASEHFSGAQRKVPSGHGDEERRALLSRRRSVRQALEAS